MNDIISRQEAIKALTEAYEDIDAEFVLQKVPLVQVDLSFKIHDIIYYLNAVLHPIVSPDHWYVYSELHDMVFGLLPVRPLPEPYKESGRTENDTKSMAGVSDWIRREDALNALSLTKENAQPGSTIAALTEAYSRISNIPAVMPHKGSQNGQIHATNADRVRAMTDDKLAEWFGCSEAFCPPGYYETNDCDACPETCTAHWLQWLKQEVTE